MISERISDNILPQMKNLTKWFTDFGIVCNDGRNSVAYIFYILAFLCKKKTTKKNKKKKTHTHTHTHTHTQKRDFKVVLGSYSCSCFIEFIKLIAKKEINCFAILAFYLFSPTHLKSQ